MPENTRLDDGAAGPLSRIPLRDQVVEVLREMVASGVLAAGDRLNEVELAAQLGISRGPLREAIQRLGAEGFVDFHHNRGAFVRTITPEDVTYIHEARELIEVAAARLAAIRATSSGIRRLEELLETAEALLADSAHAYPMELDLHELVLELAGNPYLQRAGIDLQNQIRLARVKSGSSPQRAQQALLEHKRIIAAIADRDADGAAEAMADHLRQSRDHSARHP